LGNRSFLATAHEIIYTHHEKWDGSGYPQGLKGEEIPLSGRLMAIADMYDALTSGRVYKEILPHAEAVRVMSEHAPTHFDPRIFKMFLEICAEFQLVARKHADGGA
jgi:response regulator RpfG family c-di-GMP phosphodiesterase